MPVVRVWRMLCEHVVKVSRLGRFLFIEKVITVSRFVPLYLGLYVHVFHFLGSDFFLLFYVSITGQLIYEKLPTDISERHVLLLDPILGTGSLFSDKNHYHFWVAIGSFRRGSRDTIIFNLHPVLVTYSTKNMSLLYNVFRTAILKLKNANFKPNCKKCIVWEVLFYILFLIFKLWFKNVEKFVFSNYRQVGAFIKMYNFKG
jgi:hypothetical protein